MKTWHVENATVAAILLVVWIATGFQPAEALGTVAVFCGFCCTSIADRLAEREAARAKPSVACHRAFWYFFVAKEARWFGYFAWCGAWSALAGCGVFLAYPTWRKLWRRYHPLAKIEAT